MIVKRTKVRVGRTFDKEIAVISIDSDLAEALQWSNMTDLYLHVSYAEMGKLKLNTDPTPASSKKLKVLKSLDSYLMVYERSDKVSSEKGLKTFINVLALSNIDEDHPERNSLEIYTNEVV